MVLTIIEGVVALAKLIPLLDKAIRDFFALYAKNQDEKWLREVGEAFTKGDSLSIEKAIGFSKAGKEINVPDSSIRDGRPKE
jgi:hypothetical protein